jgi:uncharacterized protein DUF1704
MSEMIDQNIYTIYRSITRGDETDLTDLRRVPEIDKEKTKFIGEGFQSNPNLTPVIDTTKLAASMWSHRALQSSIEEDDSLPSVVGDAYVPVFERDIQTVRMLMAATLGDVETYVRTNQEIYGKPDLSLFSFCLDFYSDQIARYAESDSPLVREAARQAADQLPTMSSVHDQVLPSTKQFNEVRTHFSDFYSEIFEGIDLPDEVTSKEAVPIIKQVLKNLGFDGYVIVDQNEGISTMATDNKIRKIKVPQNQSYTREDFIGTVAHEVRVHVEEAVNGRQQKLGLLALGLDGYISASEGKGILAEQLVYKRMTDFLDTPKFTDIVRRYLAIGLAQGLDGNGERDFKEVFAIVHALDRMTELAANSTKPVQAISKAIDRSWELLTKRTNKGPVGKGSAHFKDKVYLEGNIRQWGLLLNHPTVYPYLNLGKYDLTRPDHVTILRQVGTLPNNVGVGK